MFSIKSPLNHNQINFTILNVCRYLVYWNGFVVMMVRRSARESTRKHINLGRRRRWMSFCRMLSGTVSDENMCLTAWLVT